MSIKTIIFSLAMGCLTASFSQCSDSQKLEKKAPLEFGEVYYKKRPQAVRDLPSIFTLYIPIKGENDPNIELDSVYFKGKSAKLTRAPHNQNLYIGRFITKPAQPEDIILSSDVKEEHKNKLPKIEPKIPFELKPGECVISYKQAGEVKYYKISNIKEKRLKDFPMAPRNNR
jgi:hypothetical protein